MRYCLSSPVRLRVFKSTQTLKQRISPESPQHHYGSGQHAVTHHPDSLVTCSCTHPNVFLLNNMSGERFVNLYSEVDPWKS